MPSSEKTADRIGCYSTARVTKGRVERAERHARRLSRDAERIGLVPPSSRDVERLLCEAARADFPGRDGIVRVEWGLGPGESEPVLRTSTRSLGAEPAVWRALSSTIPHPGPERRFNAKTISHPAIEAARDEMRRTTADTTDEVLLFDAGGALVEGAHSNCLVVDSEGRLATPSLRLGAVEGLGLSILRQGLGSLIREERFERAELLEAREIMGVNAVRGVVAIVELDGEPIADGMAGPWARRLRRWFFRDERSAKDTEQRAV